jgi:hypothetical protein
MTAAKDSQHNDARHKRGHIFESREESFDIVGICCVAITSMVIANANAASMKVSSRVIAMPRKRNPPSRGSASNSRGKPDVISCARSSICLVILPQLSVVGEAESFPASTAFNSRQFYGVGHNDEVMTRHGIRRMLSGFVVSALVFLSPMVLSSAATLDDLKQLEITCFVPSYLTQGLRLQNVEVTYDEIQENEDQNHPLPLYAIQYGNGWNATFTIESAREGIGDRNIMADEKNSEETEIKSPFGAMYLIYRPKGKDGRKDEIIANWVNDPNMNAEKGKGPDLHPVLGRFHGFSATGITVAEFTKIIQSLHPVGGDKAHTSTLTANAPAAGKSALKIHPKVFNMIDCWISDSESPVATEINLNAVEKNGNQFNEDGLKEDGDWLSYSSPDTGGFMRYRVLEAKGNHYKIEYQENGGGTLTTASTIEFEIDKRHIRRNGSPMTIRVLRVSSYTQK